MEHASRGMHYLVIDIQQQIPHPNNKTYQMQFEILLILEISDWLVDDILHTVALVILIYFLDAFLRGMDFDNSSLPVRCSHTFPHYWIVC